MGAPDLLRHLHSAGFVLALTDTGLVAVAPASRLSNADRAAIRVHRDDLARLLACAALGPESAGCATCAHRTQAGVCGAPVAAGLAPHFEVFFCDAVPDGGVGCPAQEPKPAVWRGAWGTLADRGSTLTSDAATGLVLCTNCKHWYPGRCRNHRAAGLAVSELAAGWHALPQRCAGFKKARALVEGPTHGAVIAAPA